MTVVDGATDHMATTCSRPKENKGGSQSKPKISKAGKEKEKTEGGGTEEELPSVKDLPKEANDMLRSMNSSSSSTASTSVKGDDERHEVVERLQQQLNSLKQKPFRLKRMKKGEKDGLLDSGATHPLRHPKRRKGEDVGSYERVADGQVTRLSMTPEGAMVSYDSGIEPIIPMGQLAETLNCSVRWEKGQLQVEHPALGRLPCRRS